MRYANPHVKQKGYQRRSAEALQVSNSVLATYQSEGYEEASDTVCS